MNSACGCTRLFQDYLQQLGIDVCRRPVASDDLDSWSLVELGCTEQQARRSRDGKRMRTSSQTVLDRMQNGRVLGSRGGTVLR